MIVRKISSDNKDQIHSVIKKETSIAQPIQRAVPAQPTTQPSQANFPHSVLVNNISASVLKVSIRILKYALIERIHLLKYFGRIDSQVHKIMVAKTTPISNTGGAQNTHYVSEIINPSNGVISHNTTVLASSQSSNNSRNPVIVQPTELLPIIPISNSKRDPPRESPINIGKTVKQKYRLA